MPPPDRMAAPRRALLTLAPAILLLACEDPEVAQRRAFLDFLRTRAPEARGLRVPVPTAEERQALGPYAAHWDVIRDFHAAMNERVAGPYRAITGVGPPSNLSDIVPVARRDELARVREAVGRIRTALSEEFTRTEAARAALRQPDEVAAVYDPVFDGLVRVPARAFGAALPLVEEVLAATERLGELIAANLVRVRVSGNTIQTNDASLRARLEAQMTEVRTAATSLQDAQRRLVEMMAR